MNELIALAAPALPATQPKHRVIGVFGWIGGTYAQPSPACGTPAQALDDHRSMRCRWKPAAGRAAPPAPAPGATLKSRTAGASLDLGLPKDARLLSLAVDNDCKPVEGGPNQVRVQVPASSDSSAASTTVVILFETSAAEWSGCGELEVLAAPASRHSRPAKRLARTCPMAFATCLISQHARGSNRIAGSPFILQPLGWCSQLRCIFAPAGFAPPALSMRPFRKAPWKRLRPPCRCRYGSHSRA